MSERSLPVRPNLVQLKHQAKDLLRALRQGDRDAVALLHQHHPRPMEPAAARLADAQLVLARSYGVPSWTRLVLACRMADAIWRDQVEVVRALVVKHPELLHESVRGVSDGNWGPPMTYAANLGRDEMIEMLHGLGARDLATAFGRAALQSRIGTARKLHAMRGSPALPRSGSTFDGPASTLSASGTALLFELGAELPERDGRPLAPVEVVLESDSRKPKAKHEILEMYVQHGVVLPDTAPMALHRGRIDLLEQHLRRDPGLLRRTFSHEEIYPPELGCHDQVLATHGTPLAGATLLHMCVEYDELEILRWLLERGMDVDARAAVDADGFGGHTALFATVVSQPSFWMNLHGTEETAPVTELLLERGADPNARASLRKQLHPGYGEEEKTMHEYRDVTPL